MKKQNWNRSHVVQRGSDFEAAKPTLSYVSSNPTLWAKDRISLFWKLFMERCLCLLSLLCLFFCCFSFFIYFLFKSLENQALQQLITVITGNQNDPMYSMDLKVRDKIWTIHTLSVGHRLSRTAPEALQSWEFHQKSMPWIPQRRAYHHLTQQGKRFKD